MVSFSTLQAAEDTGLIWEKVKAEKIGYRKGSYIFYREKNNKFYIFGGNKNDQWTKKSGIADGSKFITVDADTYQVDIFVPMDDLPKNKKGRSFFPGSGGRVYVPQEDVIYCIEKKPRKTFSIYKYEIESRTLTKINDKIPNFSADGIVMGKHGYGVSLMRDVNIVYDVFNKELLFMGGHTINENAGFVGHWAFDVTKKTWRQFKDEDLKLGLLRKESILILKNLRTIQGILSNQHFNASYRNKKLENVVNDFSLLVSNIKSLMVKCEMYTGIHKLAVQYAIPKLKSTYADLTTLNQAISSKIFTPKELRKLYEIDNVLDETADLFLEFPSERVNAGINYNAKHKKILYFGGDHGNYLLNDTWLYDCESKVWLRQFPKKSPEARLANGQIFSPGKGDFALLLAGQKYKNRFIYFRRQFNMVKDAWRFDFSKISWEKIGEGNSMRSFSNPVCLNSKNKLFGIATSGRWAKIKVSYWQANLIQNNHLKVEKPRGPDQRTYFSVVKEYDPQWYIEDQKPSPEKVKTWISSLPKNTWLDVPKASKQCPTRDWGTCILDPDRDQFYHWTGGHMADPSDIVSTYHLSTNSWSIPYTATYLNKGISFEGRPDCMNHTYLNYAYDLKSKKLIISATGGMFIYDPDTRQYETPIKSSHFQHAYFTKLKSTPYGVLGWVSDKKRLFALFSTTSKKWEPIPLEKGSPFPKAAHGDEAALEYDSKRDCMWFFTAKGYRKFTGNVMRYDFKTKIMETVAAKNRATIGSKMRNLRETAFIAKQDIVLFNSFFRQDGKVYQLVFDPEKSSWAVLPISIKSKAAKKDLGGVSLGMMYDAKRNLVWAMSVRRNMYVFKPEFPKADLLYDFELKSKKKSKKKD